MKLGLRVILPTVGLVAAGLGVRAQPAASSSQQSGSDVQLLGPYNVEDAKVPASEAQLVRANWVLIKSKHFTVLAQTSEADAKDQVVALERRLEQFYRGLETTGIAVRADQLPSLTLVLFDQADDFDRYKPIEGGMPQNVPAYILSGPHNHFFAATMAVATGRESRGPAVGTTTGNQVYEATRSDLTPGSGPAGGAPGSEAPADDRYFTYNPGNDGGQSYHREPLSVSAADKTDAGRQAIQELMGRWYFSAAEVPMPLWMEAGLARVYSTSLAADGTHNTVGLTRPDDVQALQAGGTKHMAESNGQAFSQMAEIWLFMHYLTFGMGPNGSDRIVKYFQLLNSTQAASAFQTAFGMSFADAQHKAAQYLKKIPSKGYKVSVPGEDGSSPIQTSQPTKSEVQLALGSLLFYRTPNDAEPLLRSAAAELPQDKRAWETLGELAIVNNDDDRAAALFQKAIDTGSGDYLDYYELAMARVGLLRTSANTSFSLDVDADPSMKLLQKAIELKPDFEPAYRALASLIPVTGTVTTADVAALDHEIHLTPDNLMLVADRDIAQVKMGQRDAGLSALKQLLTDHPDSQQMTRTVRSFLQADEIGHLTDDVQKLFNAGRYKDAIAEMDKADTSSLNAMAVRTIALNRKMAVEFDRIQDAQALAKAGKLKPAADALNALIGEPGTTARGRGDAQSALSEINTKLAMQAYETKP